MRHRVSCAYCGKKGRVEVTIGKPMKSQQWYYWGKINLNHRETDRYYYECIFKNGNFTGKFKKKINRRFNPKVKPILLEYWECEECYYKVD